MRTDKGKPIYFNFIVQFTGLRGVYLKVARKVARNSIYKVLGVLTGSISGLLLSIYLARTLRPEQFGIYSLALSVGMISVALSNMGIDGAVVRYTSYFHGKGNLKALRGHFRYFLRIKSVLALTISLILIFLSKELALFFNNEMLTLPFVFAGLSVLFASLMNTFNSFFAGLQDFKYVFIKQVTYESGRWVFIVPLSYLFLATGAMAGIASAYLLTFIALVFIALYRFREFLIGEAEERGERVTAFMGYMTIAGISGIVFTYVDSIMIGYFIDTTHVGFYRVGYTIVFAVIGLLTMANVLFPVFTQLEGEDLLNAIRRLLRYTSAIAFPSAFALAFLSGNIIRVIYRADFAPASVPMAILSLILIPASFNFLSGVFNAKEVPQYTALVVTLSMILNVILNYFLIQIAGIAGAAIATSISRTFAIILTIYLLYRVLKLKIPVLTILKPALCSIAMLILLALFPKPGSLPTGLIEVGTAFIFYTILLFAIRGLTLDDIRYLMRAFDLRG